MPILSDLIELVFPARCVHCGAGGLPWCERCSTVGEPFTAPTSARLPVFAAGRYDGALRTALLQYKEHRNAALAPQLAAHLAAALAAAAVEGVPTETLVGMPSRRAAARQRGGDHIGVLVRQVAAWSGRSVVTPLALERRTVDSAGLSADERRANLIGSMAADPPPKNRPREIVLVDDIVTTGSTLSEAHRALSFAGWRPVAAVVVAATELRTDATQDAHTGLLV